MKSIVIYYFSGTGNTKIVADRVYEEFKTLGCQIDLVRIEDVLKGKCKINIQDYDMIGIGCQVIGFSVPNIVTKFIKYFPKGAAKNVFIFRTAGGVAPINYNSSKGMCRQLKRKDYEVIYERIFSISSNWVVGFDDEIVRRLHEATMKKVALMCREIFEGKTRSLSTPMGMKIRMNLAACVTPPLMHLIGKDLTVNDKCNGCGKCMRDCPASNIKLKNNKPKFKLSCNACLRCAYECPQRAIGFRIFKFIPIAGGYNIKDILAQPSHKRELVDIKIPPFFNEYISNENL